MPGTCTPPTLPGPPLRLLLLDIDDRIRPRRNERAVQPAQCNLRHASGWGNYFSLCSCSGAARGTTLTAAGPAVPHIRRTKKGNEPASQPISPFVFRPLEHDAKEMRALDQGIKWQQNVSQLVLQFYIFSCLTQLRPSICFALRDQTAGPKFQFVYLDSLQPLERHTAAASLIDIYSYNADCILSPLCLFVPRGRVQSQSAASLRWQRDAQSPVRCICE